MQIKQAGDDTFYMDKFELTVKKQILLELMLNFQKQINELDRQIADLENWSVTWNAIPIIAYQPLN